MTASASPSGVSLSVEDDIRVDAAPNDFEAKFASCHMLLKIVECLKELMKETVFEFNEDGIRIQTMDQARVALIDLNLKDNGLLSYKLPRGKIDVGIDMHAFAKILQRGYRREQLWMWKRVDEEVIRIRFYDASRGHVETHINNVSRILVDDRFHHFEQVLGSKIDMGKIAVDYKTAMRAMFRGDVDVKYYEMTLMDAEEFGMVVPEAIARPTAELTVGSKMFAGIISELGTFGDTLTIKVTDEGVKLMVSGDIGRGSYLLKRRADERHDRFVDMKLHDSKIGQSFSVRYLASFVKGGELCDQVGMELHNNQPFLMHFDLVHRDNGYLKFYIAPKIEGE
eukprot:GEMP01024008.1.p1 GENE.GEMP01024008.1~~GEMP01024008.1.p1  ORF type:complete len:355 (+),score=65.23 GEMP01024008.1:51-1067(+)